MLIKKGGKNGKNPYKKQIKTDRPLEDNETPSMNYETRKAPTIPINDPTKRHDYVKDSQPFEGGSIKNIIGDLSSLNFRNKRKKGVILKL